MPPVPGYRLYTVIPRLVQFIETLTNWYVRSNRNRLKGNTTSVEDCLAACQTLFEVLYTLCRAMAPVTPFITEMMYQNLRKALPQDGDGCDPNQARLNGQSVHFLDFPIPNPTYFNPEIERAVQRLQSVIELGRTIRERRNISLKTPLKEVIVLHKDQSYLDDVRSLEFYVKEELNIRNVVYSTDDKQYGVKYRAEPDSKVLGPRLGKAFKAVNDSIKSTCRFQCLTNPMSLNCL